MVIINPDMVSKITQKETFGERIRRLRKMAGLTLQELSRLTGISEGHLSRIERQERYTRAKYIKKLAEALHVSADYLLEPLNDEKNTEKHQDGTDKR